VSADPFGDGFQAGSRMPRHANRAVALSLWLILGGILAFITYGLLVYITPDPVACTDLRLRAAGLFALGCVTSLTASFLAASFAVAAGASRIRSVVTAITALILLGLAYLGLSAGGYGCS
jgi:hypothetical protein